MGYPDCSWLQEHHQQGLENFLHRTGTVYASAIWDEDVFPTDPWTNTFVAKKLPSALGWSTSLGNNLADFKLGGIVGAFDLTNCVITSKSPWFTGPYGLVIKNAEPLNFIRCPSGKSGELWDVELCYP